MSDTVTKHESVAYGTSESVSSSSKMKQLLVDKLTESTVSRNMLIEILQLTAKRTAIDYKTIRIPYSALPALADAAGFELKDVIYPDPAMLPDKSIIAALEAMPEQRRKALLSELESQTQGCWTTDALPRVNDRLATIRMSILFELDADQLTPEEQERKAQLDSIRFRPDSKHPEGMLAKELLDKVWFRRKNKRPAAINSDELQTISMITQVSMHFLLGYLGTSAKVISREEYVDDLYDYYSLIKAITPSRLLYFKAAIRSAV